ncbi:MAG: hypothetical protein LUI06_09955 [Ruminococcus sp.]|nr:hypothetical protein [Ruminococcus sp.]
MKNDIIKTETPNSITISGLSNHFIERATERNVSTLDVKDALVNSLHIGEVKVDDLGRTNQAFIGEKATVIINPITGNAITTYPTKSKISRKYKGE